MSNSKRATLQSFPEAGYFIERGVIERDTAMEVRGVIRNHILAPDHEAVGQELDPMDPARIRPGMVISTPHIASPDVHVDHDKKRIRMYFHGPITEGERLNNAFADIDHPQSEFKGNQ